MTMRAILFVYAAGQGVLAGQDPTEALRGFYAWLFAHEIAP